MSIELSIVMPCLNEIRTLPTCIRKAMAFIEENGIEGEIVVADNGSTDGSIDAARSLGARVVSVPVKGYGAALTAGIEAAQGKFVIMGDSDDSYDFSALLPFVEKLREGYDLVMGNRFRGGIADEAMPVSHRYFGNPFLSAVGRLFFKCKEIGDFYCGLRGFRKSAVQRLKLQSLGMEFALEMVVKSQINGLRITEVPTTLSPDGRDRAPHLRTYRDGWRSLRFYLLMSPRWFFGIPGGILIALGLVICAMLVAGPKTFGSVTIDYHTLLYGAAAIVIGYQSVLMSVFAKLMAIETGLHPTKTKLGYFQKRETLERFAITGLVLAFVGFAFGVGSAVRWWSFDFGALSASVTIRLVIASCLFMILGSQTLLAGFYLGMLQLLTAQRLNPFRQAGA